MIKLIATGNEQKIRMITANIQELPMARSIICPICIRLVNEGSQGRLYVSEHKTDLSKLGGLRNRNDSFVGLGCATQHRGEE